MSPTSSYKISSDLVISSWNLLTNPDNPVQSCRSNAVVDSKKTKGQVIADFHVKSTGRSEAVLTNAENSKASRNVGGQSAALTATCSSDHLDTEHRKYDTGDKITRQTSLSKSKKLETVNSVALPYEDQICNNDFNVKGDLVRHTKTHGTKRPFKCDECEKTFVNAGCLTRHKKTHTGERPFKCNECGSGFFRSDHLTRHKKTHTGERPFKCDVCGSGFFRSDHLKEHKSSHTGKRSFQCDTCKNEFINTHSLKRHKRIHAGERPFKCDICDKTFTQKGSLTEHKRIHSGERPFKCDACDKTFIQRYHLTLHERTHISERPFKCDVCEKTFNQKGNLKEHKRIHSSEYPFKCDACDKAFNQKRNLTEHKRIHTGEFPFKCDVCDKAFNQKNNLTRHKKRLHTDEYPFKSTNSKTGLTTPDDVSTITQLPSASNQPSTSDIHINKSQNQEEYREYTETVALLNEFIDTYPVTPDPGSCEHHDDLFLDQEMPEATFPDKQNADAGYLITQLHPVAGWPSTSGIHVNKSQHQEKYEETAEVLDYNHLQTIPPPKPSWDSDYSPGDYDDDDFLCP